MQQAGVIEARIKHMIAGDRDSAEGYEQAMAEYFRDLTLEDSPASSPAR